MDKKILKEFFEFVEKYLSNGGVSIDFSIWHTDKYLDVIKYVSAKSNCFIYNGQQYLISFSAAQIDMGDIGEGFPDTWTVSKVLEEEIFNADVFLNMKTFRISDWKLGTESKRVEKLG